MPGERTLARELGTNLNTIRLALQELEFLGLVRRVEVYAVCTKYQVEVVDPYVGCGHCHPQAAAILDALKE